MSAKEVPYWVTVFVALIAWSLTHVVERLSQSPIIEYCKTKKVDQKTDVQTTVFTIRNITAGTLFKDLTFYVRSDKGYSLAHPKITPSPPMFDASDDPPESKLGEASFKIPLFQPDGEVSLSVETPSGASLWLLVNSSNAIQLAPASIKTFLIRNEYLILLGSTLLWLFLIIAWYARTRRATNP